MKFHGTKIDERAQSLSIDLGSRSLLSHSAALIRRHFSPFVRWNRAEGNYARNICSPSSNPFDQFESIDKRPSTSMNKALDVFFIFLFFFFRHDSRYPRIRTRSCDRNEMETRGSFQSDRSQPRELPRNRNRN